jgi:hypothetical protein
MSMLHTNYIQPAFLANLGIPQKAPDTLSAVERLCFKCSLQDCRDTSAKCLIIIAKLAAKKTEKKV